jgi:hypothetical protein
MGKSVEAFIESWVEKGAADSGMLNRNVRERSDARANGGQIAHV